MSSLTVPAAAPAVAALPYARPPGLTVSRHGVDTAACTGIQSFNPRTAAAAGGMRHRRRAPLALILNLKSGPPPRCGRVDDVPISMG
jgi:hypothetical protein